MLPALLLSLLAHVPDGMPVCVPTKSDPRVTECAVRYGAETISLHCVQTAPNQKVCFR